MQKTLSIAAPTASLILFVAVAAHSKATLPVLGGYGTVFLFVAPILFSVLALRGLRKWKTGSAVLRSLLFLAAIYPAGVIATALFFAIINHERVFSWHEYTVFGANQIVGVAGILVTALVAAALAGRRKFQTYRKCPYCISHIPREASRCKFCTAPVEPEERPTKITRQQSPIVVTGTGSNFKRSPLNYTNPGHKRDFGQLSVPRVGSVDTTKRTRPLPSEVDAQRRQRS